MKEKRKTKIEKLMDYISKENDLTIDEVSKIWSEKTPHFGGYAPHRMQGMASEYIELNNEKDFKVCVYCLKPEKYREVKNGNKN